MMITNNIIFCAAALLLVLLAQGAGSWPIEQCRSAPAFGQGQIPLSQTIPGIRRYRLNVCVCRHLSVTAGAPEQTAMQTATGPIRPVSQTAMATKRDPGNRRHLMTLSRMHNADVKSVVDTATTTSATSTTASADTADKAMSTDTANNADMTTTLSAAQGTDTTNNADHYGLGGWGGGWGRGYYSYPNYHYHSYSGLGHHQHHHGWRRLLGAK